MKEILKSYKKGALPTDKLLEIGNLLFYDYPLQTLYRTNKGQLFVCKWVDRNEKLSRWLLFEVSLDTIQKYVQNDLSALQIMEAAPTPFIVFDVDEERDFKNIYECDFDDLPLSYLAKSSAYFDPHFADYEALQSYFESRKFVAKPSELALAS